MKHSKKEQARTQGLMIKTKYQQTRGAPRLNTQMRGGKTETGKTNQGRETHKDMKSKNT